MENLISKNEAENVILRYFFEHKDSEKLRKEFDEIPVIQSEIIRCKNCKFFEYDHVEIVSGVPLIVAHEICRRISDGVKVAEDGYCFLAEKKEEAQ